MSTTGFWYLIYGRIPKLMLHLHLYLFLMLDQFGQEPEPSQANGMALVRCILDKFLEVVFHCFPPRLDVSTSAARCLHVLNDARDSSSERWNHGRGRLSGNFAYMVSLFTPLGIFTCCKYTALLPF